MYNDTCNRLFESKLPLNLITGTLEKKYKELNYDNVDTIIMSEVIEHLSEDEFWNFLNYALPYLKKNNTMLIIVNALGFWPIEKNDYDHIWRIDDSIYDHIQSLARTTIIRSSSHLVIEF
jgi:predicted SAM-dependent methyltransferase